MPAAAAEDRALRAVDAFERSGRTVRRVIISGKEIHLILADGEVLSDYDLADMKK